MAILAQSTGRTRPVGPYFRGSTGLQKDSTPFAKRIAVDGQILRVKAVSGPRAEALAGMKEIIVIWWGFDPSCARSEPFNSAPVPRGAEVFIAAEPRDSSQWIGHRPTFDLDIVPYAYAPELLHHSIRFAAPDSAPAMSAREFAGIYWLLPDQIGIDKSVGSGLLKWANDHPKLARKHPAAAILGFMRDNGYGAVRQ